MTIEKFLQSKKIKSKNMNIYYEAFTHPSFTNENDFELDYQRLEFLGDSIIQQFVTKIIFKSNPDLDEGQMSILRASIISGKTLATISIKMGLDKVIRFGKGLKELNAKIKADVFESFIGAIYLDLGDSFTNKFLNDIFVKIVSKSKKNDQKNPKTKLQEYLQSESRENIKYKTEASKSGFISRIMSGTITFGKGIGKTKKDAEVSAAEDALKKLVGESNETN